MARGEFIEAITGSYNMRVYRVVDGTKQKHMACCSLREIIEGLQQTGHFLPLGGVNVPASSHDVPAALIVEKGGITFLFGFFISVRDGIRRL